MQAANDRAGKAFRSSFQVLVRLGGEDADFVPSRGEAVHDIANANFVAAVGVGRIKRGNGQDAHRFIAALLTQLLYFLF